LPSGGVWRIEQAMFSFGTSTSSDALSWVIVISLGAKVIATLILLVVDRERRDTPGWGSALWWVTKITPLIAVPAMIALAMSRRDTHLAWAFGALGVFALLAIFHRVRQRSRRMA
jgi:hypothetical protein